MIEPGDDAIQSRARSRSAMYVVSPARSGCGRLRVAPRPRPPPPPPPPPPDTPYRPPPHAAVDRLGLRARGHERLAHTREHRARRVRVGDEELAVDALALHLGPGGLEEAQQARVMDCHDRPRAVIGRRDDLEATVGGECREDRVRAGRHLVCGDRHAEVGLDPGIVSAVALGMDDLHPWIVPATKGIGAAAYDPDMPKRPRGSPRGIGRARARAAVFEALADPRMAPT